MPWARLDDGYLTHPKVLAADQSAVMLHLASISYCSRELTDGFIASGALPLVAVLGKIVEPGAAVEQLVTLRLWDVAEGGWWVHDYLDYNPSREQVMARREANARRQGRFRAERTSQKRNAVTNTVSNGPGNGRVTPAPDPVPVPVPLPEESPAPRARAREAPAAEQGWPLVDAMLTTLETAGRVAEGWVPSGRWRARQQAIGAELAAEGWTATEVGDLVGWLLTHPHWGTTDLDMKVVREVGDNWRREGRPARYVAAAPARASPARPGSLDVIIDGLTRPGPGERHERRDVPRRTSDPADRVAAPRAGRGDRGGALPRLPRGPG